MRRALTATLSAAVLGLLAGCGGAEEPQATPAAAPPAGSFRSHGCNGVTDEDVTKAAESTGFKKVLDSDAGCFWQEDTMLGAFGAGMGISLIISSVRDNVPSRGVVYKPLTQEQKPVEVRLRHA